MIKDIFPRSYIRYISLGIFGNTVDDFTAWLHKRGYKDSSIIRPIREIVWIDHFLSEHNINRINDITYELFEKTCSHYQNCRPFVPRTIQLIKEFLQEKKEFEFNVISITPIKQEQKCFGNYMQNVKGFAESTIQRNLIYSKEFLAYIRYDTNPNALKNLSLKKIDSFIRVCSTRLSRYSLRNVIGYLRNFLRFEYEQGVLHRAFSKELDSPRIYRFEKLPHTLSRETIQNFLKSIDCKGLLGIRDYTIFFLASTYGLRAGEIAALTLDDIDWRAGVLRILNRKTKDSLILPLTDAAGDVLIEYLKKDQK